jgi:hypothetical protein
MAFGTYRNATMFLRVTGRTFLFSMLGDLGLQACCYLGMTKLTAAFQVYRVGYGYQRLVRVGMTVKALHNRFRWPVGRIMAAGTFGHDLLIVVAQRVVGVKNLMAFG